MIANTFLGWGIFSVIFLLVLLLETIEFECLNMVELNKNLENQNLTFVIILSLLTCSIYFID